MTESDPGPNFMFTSLDCSASETSDGTTINISNATVSFALAANDKVDCTYTNTLKTGAILVTKTRKHAASGSSADVPHAGVDITVNGVTKATNADGQACFDGLTFGTYTVHETVPAGYQVDGNDKQVTVDNVAACGDNPYGGETVSFHNTPLTDVSITVNSQVNGGTKTIVDCDDNSLDGTTGADGDGTFSTTDEQPHIITCTINIDP